MFYNELGFKILMMIVEICLYCHKYNSIVVTTSLIHLILALPAPAQLAVYPVPKLADSSVHSRVPEHK